MRRSIAALTVALVVTIAGAATFPGSASAADQATKKLS